MLLQRRLSHGLGLFGLLPFLLSLLAPLWGLADDELFINYSLVILSFLAGSLWGRSLASERQYHSALLIVSNMIAVAAWLAASFLSGVSTLLLLASGYMAVLASEYRYGRGWPPGYLQLRSLLTAAVVLLHLLAVYLTAF